MRISRFYILGKLKYVGSISGIAGVTKVIILTFYYIPRY